MKKKLYPLLLSAIVLFIMSFETQGQEPPKPGELIITEFLANPEAVSDTRGEWVELLNISRHTLVLNGIIVKDDGSNLFDIEGDEQILLGSGQYFLMARNADPEMNGGIHPDYIYSNFTLGNSEDEIILTLPDGEVLDQLKYDSGWEVNSGVSLELNPRYMDSGFNQEAFKWNLAVKPYGSGDLGSPGSENSSTSSMASKVVIEELKVYPNPCYGIMNIHLQLNMKVDVKISLINLVGQEILVYDYGKCQEISLPMDTEWMEKGVWLIRLNYGGNTMIKKVLVY